MVSSSLLDKVEGHIPFITLSFVIRIVEAMGNAAFLTASFAIIAKEFPDKIALTFVSISIFIHQLSHMVCVFFPGLP